MSYKETVKFNQWKNNYINKDKSHFGLFQYIGDVVQPDDLLIIADLIHPKIVWYKECLFFEEKFSQTSVDQWNDYLDGNFTAIQKIINKFPMYDLFLYGSESVSDKVLEKTALFLKSVWGIYFKTITIDKKPVIVKYSNTENDYGPTLCVYQE